MGLTGVFIFFVHTCLVLMQSLERKPYPLDFYIRRIFRIYPAAVAILLLTVAFHLPALNVGDAKGFHYIFPTHKEVLYNLLLLQNFRGRVIVGIMWTLPLEMQMYLFLPPIFFYVARNLSLWTVLSLWIFAVTGAYLTFGSYPAMSLLLCVPCFLPGVMAYVGLKRWRPRFPAWLFPVALWLLIAAYLRVSTLYGAWAFCLVLGLVLPFFRQLRHAPTVAVARTLAKYSYSLYLVHTFANYVGIDLLAHRGLAVRLLTILVVLVGGSALLYHAVEEPFLRLGVRCARRAERFYGKEAQASRIAIA